MRFAVIGAGAYGTAAAIMLAENGHETVLWGRDPGRLAAIDAARENLQCLPGVRLPAGVQLISDWNAALAGSEVAVIAAPSRAIRDAASRIKDFPGAVISLTKGLEPGTGLTMCGVIQETAPAAQPVAVSGPSLADEVARRIPTAVVAASADEALARQAQQWLSRPYFRVYTSRDRLGVELGGALKNVIAIAAGVCDGLGFGDNSKAALVTRGQAEMRRLGVAMGARPETFAGLSGLGDLTVTCFSRLSRNRSFGERLGRGEAADTLAAMTTVVEGRPTAQSAHELAERTGTPCPIVAEVHAMLYLGKNPRRAVVDLLNRDLKAED